MSPVIMWQMKNKQMKVFEWNKLDILKGNRLRLPKFASVGMVVNLPDLGYILLTLFDYRSLCCRSPSKTIFMYLNTLRVPLALPWNNYQPWWPTFFKNHHYPPTFGTQTAKFQNPKSGLRIPRPSKIKIPSPHPKCKIQNKNEKQANEGFRMKQIGYFKRK